MFLLCFKIRFISFINQKQGYEDFLVFTYLGQ